MLRTGTKWLGIGGALVALAACGSPQSQQAREPGAEPEASDTRPADEAVFDEGFEQGDAGEWTESEPEAPEGQERAEEDPGIE
jgi:hypothetical protein